MSLLAGIQSKKNKLKATDTVVYTVTGEKYKESSNSLGQKTVSKLNEGHAGYVVDLKPDLQIAKVLPFLYFGSQDVAADFELLNTHGITHILSLGIKPFQQFPYISYKFIDLLDSPEENLLDVLCLTNELIKCVEDRPPSKIFVHCNAGCSRAPSVVIGYLIYSLKISYKEAYNLIGQVRYIRPNDGFVQQLKRYGNNNLE